MINTRLVNRYISCQRHVTYLELAKWLNHASSNWVNNYLKAFFKLICCHLFAQYSHYFHWSRTVHRNGRILPNVLALVQFMGDVSGFLPNFFGTPWHLYGPFANFCSCITMSLEKTFRWCEYTQYVFSTYV